MLTDKFPHAFRVGNSNLSMSSKWATKTIIQEVRSVKRPINPSKVKKDIFSARSSVKSLYKSIAYAATKNASTNAVILPNVDLFSFSWVSVRTIKTTDSRVTTTPISFPQLKSSQSRNSEKKNTKTIEVLDRMIPEHIEVNEIEKKNTRSIKSIG